MKLALVALVLLLALGAVLSGCIATSDSAPGGSAQGDGNAPTNEPPSGGQSAGDDSLQPPALPGD